MAEVRSVDELLTLAAGSDGGLNSVQSSARRIIYVEGIPTLERDILCDAGFDVSYCNTTALPKLRRELEAEGTKTAKGDKHDPILMRDYVDRIKWYRATATEPVIREAIKLFKNRELLVGLGKLKAQYEKSRTYRDETFFADTDTVLAEMRKRADAALVAFCKRNGLHDFHTAGSVDAANFVLPPARRFPVADGSVLVASSEVVPAAGDLLYGIGCVTIVAAAMKRPWIFSMNGWRHYNGVTSHAWDGEHAQMRSQGTDGLLKALIHGSIMTLLSQKSPWRPYYDEMKAKFEPTEKTGKSGRGKFKVTPHAKAVNRVKTRIIENLKRAVDTWYEKFLSPAGHVVLADSVVLPAAGDTTNL